MSAYLIIDLEITDLDGFMEYASRIPDLIAKHQGQYLVQGVLPFTVQGEVPEGLRSVILQFPSSAFAKRFLEERQASDLHEIWSATTMSRILLVDGNDENSELNEGS